MLQFFKKKYINKEKRGSFIMKEFFMKKKYLLIIAFLLFAISIIPTRVYAVEKWHLHFDQFTISDIKIYDSGRLESF